MDIDCYQDYEDYSPSEKITQKEFVVTMGGFRMPFSTFENAKKYNKKTWDGKGKIQIVTTTYETIQ